MWADAEESDSNGAVVQRRDGSRWTVEKGGTAEAMVSLAIAIVELSDGARAN